VTDSNDWRVTISLPGPAHAERARQSLSEREVEEDVRRRLGRSVAVGAGDSQIFLYAGTEVAAREAEQVAREVLAPLGIEAEFAVHRWHPVEEEWEDPAVALPRTEAERDAEHQRLEDAETAESLATGTAEWQARVELPSHRDAVALARKLQSEGHTVLRRWRFLIVGAADEDDAQQITERIRQEAPPGATVVAEAAGVRLPYIAF
jgi:hypothetical protein